METSCSLRSADGKRKEKVNDFELQDEAFM